MDIQATSSHVDESETAHGSAGAEFVDQFAAAWASSNVDSLMALLAEDVVLVQPMMPATVGKAASRASFSRLFELIPDLHATVHRWAAHDALVFIEFTLSGTLGGREVSWPVVDRFVLRDGLVAERVSYFDTAPLAFQMLKRPRAWRRLLSSGFRPSITSSTPVTR